jgi:hypothetical protein
MRIGIRPISGLIVGLCPVGAIRYAREAEKRLLRRLPDALLGLLKLFE